MTRHQTVVPSELIARRILVFRGQKVMLDADLAELYGVTTKALNQAVKRNSERFPTDFMFRLTGEEKREVVTNCDHLENLKYSPTLPHAFTEHGALMLGNVLKSPRAIEVSLLVVRNPKSPSTNSSPKWFAKTSSPPNATNSSNTTATRLWIYMNNYSVLSTKRPRRSKLARDSNSHNRQQAGSYTLPNRNHPCRSELARDNRRPTSTDFHK